ncbi:hypothetical protein Tco_1176378 [Tanacetum coccineum]
MMAHSIVDRSQEPEKVTVTDLFYLRGLDVGSVNIPYLLARYLRRFAAGRKSGALISGRQFVARLAEHFGLLTEERLQGLTVTAHALPIVDMAELVRLQICVEFGDTWAWVPAGPAMQEGDAGGVAEEALVAPGGGDEDEEMPQTMLLLPRTQEARLADLAAKKSTKLVKYRSSEILYVIGVLKSQDDCSTHILAHKLNLENLPSKISGYFLILILLIPVFNVLSIQRGRCIIQVGDGN